MDIPTIDFAPFLAEEGVNAAEAPTEAQLAVAKQIDTVCRQHGFVYVNNLGISPEVRAAAFNASRTLFDLPDEHKLNKMSRILPSTNSGYSPFGRESLNTSRPADMKEAFNVRDPNTADFSGCPEGHEEITRQLWLEIKRASDRYAVAIAVALGLPTDYFTSRMQLRDNCTLRMLHYPPCDMPTTDGKTLGPVRIGEHTDFGMFTLLFLGKGSRGLQIKPVEGGEVGGKAGGEADGWFDVMAPEGDNTVLINTGALLARWTNDTWRATAHRVIVPDAEAAAGHRYSIAFFADPDTNAEVSVDPRFVPTGEQPRYPPTTGSDYLLSKLTEMALVK